MRGQNGGATDNVDVVRGRWRLRAEKARLLGYDSYAALKLDDTMAKTPSAVLGLLEPVWDKAREKAAADQRPNCSGSPRPRANEDIAGWDWRFWQEKLRAEKYAFDEAELKPYLQLDRIIEACFDVATRLFGITFEEVEGVAAWHADVRVFEVRNADGTYRGTFLADYFARPSKRSGAWMSSLRSGYRLGEGSKPVIYNVMNFAKPQPGQPALLSMDEARTLFHEFGHALHGMLTDVTWPSVSGTSVSRDFVELPSQLYEHWLTVPQVLEKHARHAETGKPMPKALIDKMLAARNFGAGFATVEFTASALVDMAYHARSDAPADPAAFEAETLKQLEMPDAIAMRHRTPHFGPRLRRRRLFGRLLLLHVVGGARRRRLRRLRGDRRSVRSGAGGKAARAYLRRRRLEGSRGALPRLPRQDADGRGDDGQARPGLRGTQRTGRIGRGPMQSPGFRFWPHAACFSSVDFIANSAGGMLPRAECGR